MESKTDEDVFKACRKKIVKTIDVRKLFDKTLKNFILIFIACSETDQYLGHDEVMKEEIDASKFIISASVLSILILVYFPPINYPIAYLSTSAISFFSNVIYLSSFIKY